MKLFLVRHGSTGLIEQKIRQTKESLLNKSGIAQVKATSLKLQDQSIDLIFTSDWSRAYQTAEIIGNDLHVKPQINVNLHEIDHPPELYGATEADPIYQEYRQQKIAMLTDLDWRFKNQGESIRDMVDRAKKVKHDLISQYSNKNIVLVSHAFFIRALTTNCLLGDLATDDSILHVFHALNCGHASITFLELPEGHIYFQLRQLDNTSHIIE